jgi:hypothetical protein
MSVLGFDVIVHLIRRSARPVTAVPEDQFTGDRGNVRMR